MAIKDYDTIVDMIEENLTLDWMQIKTRVLNYMCLNERNLNEFLKIVEPNGKTLRQYYAYRKLCNAMLEQKNGRTQEELAEKYNFSDANHLSNEIKAHFGKSATELLHEGFSFSQPQHIVDIVYKNGLLQANEYENYKTIEKKEQVISHMKSNEETYKTELISAIDNIVSLQRENEELKAIIRRNNIKKNSSGAENNNIQITKDMYEEFQNIERCRVVYDFTTEKIIKLYHKSLQTGIDLETLCIAIDDTYAFEKYKEELYSEYAIEATNYMTEYEGSSIEVYREYFSDDDPIDCPEDPYESQEWEYELSEYKNDISPEELWDEYETEIEYIEKTYECDPEDILIDLIVEEIMKKNKDINNNLKEKEEDVLF